jgi:ribose 5-phosphate isomerase B
MKIVIGSDEAGFELKEIIKEHLANKYVVTDIGVYDKGSVMYPDIALKVSKSISLKEHERGILICGTGIGMAITANKINGIRAAQCHDVYSAERAGLSNNAHIITLGALIIGSSLAKKIVDAWLAVEFMDGRSTPKIERIMEIEENQIISAENNTRGEQECKE